MKIRKEEEYEDISQNYWRIIILYIITAKTDIYSCFDSVQWNSFSCRGCSDYCGYFGFYVRGAFG